MLLKKKSVGLSWEPAASQNQAPNSTCSAFPAAAFRVSQPQLVRDLPAPQPLAEDVGPLAGAAAAAGGQLHLLVELAHPRILQSMGGLVGAGYVGGWRLVPDWQRRSVQVQVCTHAWAWHARLGN